MKSNVYAVHDTLAQLYLQPFHAASNEVAIRIFTAVVNDNDSWIYRNPEDYNLVLLGVFDDTLGLFDTHVPQFLCTAQSRVSIPEVNYEISNGSSI